MSCPTILAEITPMDTPNEALNLSVGEVYHSADRSVTINGTEISPAQLDDFQTASEVVGISLTEAVDRYAWQEDFVHAVMAIEDRFPADYAGSAIVDDGASAWIAFRGVVPDAVRGMIQELPKPVELVSQRGFSRIEIVNALNEAYYSIYNRDDVLKANGWVDIAEGVVFIEAVAAPSLSESGVAQLEDHFRDLPHSSELEWYSLSHWQCPPPSRPNASGSLGREARQGNRHRQ